MSPSANITFGRQDGAGPCPPRRQVGRRLWALDRLARRQFWSVRPSAEPGRYGRPDAADRCEGRNAAWLLLDVLQLQLQFHFVTQHGYLVTCLQSYAPALA